MNRLPHLSRRDWLRLNTAGVVGFSLSGWLETLAADVAGDPKRKRACILLWMSGGPSQIDTWDLKPTHENGGQFKEIATSVPGIKISEHLPKLAQHMKEMAIVRSMSTKEADHGRATFQMRTGRPPGGPIEYPSLGALVAKELERPDAELPSFVAVAPFRFLNQGAFGPGFLGPRYAPLIVGENAGNLAVTPETEANLQQSLKVEDLALPDGVTKARSNSRLRILDDLEQDFLRDRALVPSLSHRTAYQRAVTMMRSAAAKAFDLDEEPDALRDKYGPTLFGRGCLLARRLVERGVPFVEVTLSSAPGLPAGLGWDTHQDNFENVKKLSGVLDQAWSTLLDDLKARGLLDTTLIVWMGEFGRTPAIAGDRKGRDHWANAWSTVLAGGGIKGGQVIGKTSADGMSVTERPVSVPDFLATVALALGMDITKQNNSNVGRPIRLVEPSAQPIKEVLG